MRSDADDSDSGMCMWEFLVAARPHLLKLDAYAAYVYDNFISRHCHFFKMVLVILKGEKEPQTHPNH